MVAEKLYPGPVDPRDAGTGWSRNLGGGSASILPMTDEEKERAREREERRIVGFGGGVLEEDRDA